MDTKKQKKSTARIFVLFARKDDSFDESFAGVALTRAQEKAMGQRVDRSGVTCWTEETCLRGWNGPLDEEHHQKVVFTSYLEVDTRRDRIRRAQNSIQGLRPHVLRETKPRKKSPAARVMTRAQSS